MWNKIYNFIVNANVIVVILAGSSIGISVQKFFKWKKTNAKRANEKLRLLESGMLAILHNKLYITLLGHIETGNVTTDDLEDIEYLMRPYKALGGNGTAERLYKQVLTLPVVK